MSPTGAVMEETVCKHGNSLPNSDVQSFEETHTPYLVKGALYHFGRTNLWRVLLWDVRPVSRQAITFFLSFPWCLSSCPLIQSAESSPGISIFVDTYVHELALADVIKLVPLGTHDMVQ